MELLNTTVKDNEVFFGKARGTGSFALIGPQSDIPGNISAASAAISVAASRIRSSLRIERACRRTWGAAAVMAGVTDMLVALVLKLERRGV